jgi:hypothetical protein
MIGTTTSDAGDGQVAASRPSRAGDVVVGVRTNALDLMCDDLRRAVDQGQRLLEHPGVVRGRAQDAGDDVLRDAVVAFAARWEWGLQVLVDDAAALARDITAAARLYDEVERTSIVGARGDARRPR